MTVFYVYLTEQCKNDATKHGVIEDIEKFAEKLEKDQSTRGLKRFPKPYWKKSIAKGRIVIEEYDKTEPDIILCLSRYLVKGPDKREYEESYKDTENFWNKNKVFQSEEEAEKFLEERKRKPIIPKKELSDIELQYLQSMSSHKSNDDGAFLESYDWVERMSQEWTDSYEYPYYELITKIELGQVSPEETLASHEKDPNINILYRYFLNQNQTFLIAPINPNEPNDEEKLREKYKEILEPKEEDIVLETIIRKSRRAYPSLIIYDQPTWSQVEKSAEANLALSPEEEKILQLILNNESKESQKPKEPKEPKYPLFINGRPGSGKSTILQYLFSEHLTQYLNINDNNSLSSPPLYLTYSIPLLNQARSSVENILKCDAKRLKDGYNPQKTPKWKPILQQSFRSFRDFLHEQLPSEEKTNFALANHINFEQFRKKWNAKRKTDPNAEVRDISSELAWHTIRTFIKGMLNESGAEVDPEFYEFEVARDSKSISNEKFQLIYHNVWEGWYQKLCKEQGLWDDQDLARAVWEHSANELSRYPAVFCDEAQDFTSIEIELIERLSLYSDRQVPSYLVKDVPFAFAGDPFQTLNPTGFNWTATKASFHRNIVQDLDSSGSAQLEFNYQELSFNYRSSKEIVKLANLIQLLRGGLLKIKGLRPQESWTEEETRNPVWYSIDDAKYRSKIREQSELVIIIPCQENGEQEYVENDNFLKDFALENKRIKRNILSPARAKGLEYNRVLLYKFGEEAKKGVSELLQHIDDPSTEPSEMEELLAWEYFLNQFYVAVSRARKRLFIVDSELGLNEFWKFTEIQKQRQLLELYNKIDSSKHWHLKDDLDKDIKSNVGGIIPGDENSWSDDRDDPFKLANDYESQGRAQRDPYLLNLASSNYERANRPEKAQLCQAAAYEFSEDFVEAGNLFKELGQAKDACRCYWAGKDVDAISQLVEKFAKIAADPRYIAASVIKREQNNAEQINVLLTSLKSIEPIGFAGSTETSAWQWFFEQLVTKVARAIESSGDNKFLSWKPLVEGIVTTLSRLEISPKSYPNIAKLYYLVEEYQQAVNFWDKCSTTQKQPEWVTESRAKIEPYPQNLKYYHQLKDDNAVIEAWRNADCLISSETPVNMILECARKIGDVNAIRSLLPACNDIEKVIDVMRDSKDEVLRELRGSIPVAINQCFEANGAWEEIVNFTEKQEITSNQYRLLSQELRKSNLEWNLSIAIAAAVRVLARSQRLANENSKYQQIISEFLKQYLIIDKSSSPTKRKRMLEVHEILGIAEVGSAFERAFRLVFALEYYEQCYKKNSLIKSRLSLSSQDIELAKRRWMKCKYFQGEMQEGSRGDENKEEAQKMANELNVSIDDEPKYLELPVITELNIPTSQEESFSEPPQSETMAQKDINSTVESPEPEKPLPSLFVKGELELVINDVKFNLSINMQKQRICLKRADTGDEVLCSARKVSSNDDVSVKHLPDSSTVKLWAIEEWGIHCEIEADGGSSTIRLKTSEGNPIIGFELPKKGIESVWGLK